MASEKYISKSTPRNSSIELLRIIAMLAIVVSHASLHSCFPERPSVLALNNHFLNWMVLGNLGVNIFVLITGYFSCTKPMNTNGILKNLTEVWFYSLFCGLLYVLSGGSVSERQLLIIFSQQYLKNTGFSLHILL